MGEFFKGWGRKCGSKPPSRIATMIVGFVIGSAFPIAYGIFWMCHEVAHHASLPRDPNLGRCGMGMMVACLMTFIVGPTCGAIGAGVGFVFSTIFRKFG